jgi:hypothetical protein
MDIVQLKDKSFQLIEENNNGLYGISEVVKIQNSWLFKYNKMLEHTDRYITKKKF